MMFCDDTLRDKGNGSTRHARMPMAAVALLVFLLMNLPTAAALAREDSAARRLKDRAELSAVSTSGNTDVLTLSFKNKLAYEFSETLLGTWNVTALYSEQDGEQNAGRYTTDLRLDHDISSRTYLYALGGWLRDRFAGFDNRYNVGPGIGRKFLIGPRHFFKAEIGANWTREDYTTGDTEDFLEGRGYAQYDLAISEGSTFLQSIEYLQDIADGDNFKVATETAVTSALTKVLAIKIAYEVRYQNRPVPETLDKTDTVLSASLVVDF